MELSGLTMVGAAWPEFKQSADWIAYAKSRLTSELDRQVYPDGVQTELTSHYHYVALANFEQFADICRAAHVPLPTSFTKRLESMWNYLACSMRPDGYGLLNNDSDKDFNRPRVLKAAATYGREDWRYIAANGRSGRAPRTGPSFVFPWAGQLIMRSGYDRDAQWAFFDLGSWGTGHQHNDKLHLSVAAFGRDLLVDSGRFAYSGVLAAKFRRRYACHSAGHNVILIDGRGQAPNRARADKPLDKNAYRIEPDYDYARGYIDRFDRIKGTAKHTRTVYYLRNRLWIVVDRIDTDRPRTIQALWHWHSHCTVVTDEQRVRSTDPGVGNLEIIPLGSLPWRVVLVKGQEKPTLQGWYSEKYNQAVPCPTAVYCAKVQGETTFAWALVPAKGQVPRRDISVVSSTASHFVVRVASPKGEHFDVVVPLSDAADN